MPLNNWFIFLFFCYDLFIDFKMAPWVRRIFIHRLPKILLMRVPKRVSEEVEQRMKVSENVDYR